MKRMLKIASLLAASTMIAACGGSGSVVGDGSGDGGDDTTTAEFEIAVTNLTNAQPLSPPAIMLHGAGFNSFIDGEVASTALEVLAEGGDNSQVLSEAQAASQHLASASGSGPVGPQSVGEAVSLEVAADQLDDVRLSVITMLVHTNDAFTGTNALDVSGMSVGDTRVITAPAWDSGTEGNSETRATIPGPDFGGEGFNAERDDAVDVVRFHASVVTSASVQFGLATSDLTDQHRFLNPTSRVSITRVR